jgi:GntR family transcriptional regulator
MTGARFREIADDLRERIALGDIGGSGAMDSEAALGQRYSASRVTVRKALELLRDQGLVDSRQGSGWFVSSGSFHQRLALGTFRHAESAITDTGASVQRNVVRFAWEPATARVATILELAPDTQVLHSTSVRCVDGVPLDSATEYAAGAAAQAISRADAAFPGVWHTLARSGVGIATVRQSIAAGIAGPDDQLQLGAPAGSPLLLIRRVAIGSAGAPVAVSDHRYLAHRFTLEVEFNGFAAGVSDSPPGLRDTGS